MIARVVEAIVRSRLGICQLPFWPPVPLAPRGYYVHVRSATIYLAPKYGAESAWSDAIAAELRSRRLVVGLSQVQLGDPLSGSYVSAVETGKVVPSLPALLLMLERLGLSAPIFFEAVNCRLRSL